MDFIKAIQKPTDYSGEFTNHVSKIRDHIYTLTGLECKHDTDMNYSASQKLTLWTNKQGEVVSNHKVANYQIDFLISSKAKLYTVVYLIKDKGVWLQASEASVVEKLKFREKSIRKCLDEINYSFIPQSQLSDLVEDHFTELDGVPATIFQILFSEMY